MKCPQCGKELPRNSKFCQYCGSAIPQKPIRKSVVILTLLLSLSVIGNIYSSYQYYSILQVYEQAQEQIKSIKSTATKEKQKRIAKEDEIKEKNKKIKKLEDDVEFLSDLVDSMATELYDY